MNTFTQEVTWYKGQDEDDNNGAVRGESCLGYIYQKKSASCKSDIRLQKIGAAGFKKFPKTSAITDHFRNTTKQKVNLHTGIQLFPEKKVTVYELAMPDTIIQPSRSKERQVIPLVQLKKIPLKCKIQHPTLDDSIDESIELENIAHVNIFNVKKK